MSDYIASVFKGQVEAQKRSRKITANSNTVLTLGARAIVMESSAKCEMVPLKDGGDIAIHSARNIGASHGCACGMQLQLCLN